jgi:hypothetical protein
MTSTMPPPPPASPFGPPRPGMRRTIDRHSPVGMLFAILAVGLAIVTIGYGVASIVNALALRTYHETLTFPLVDDLVLRAGDADITLIADATDEITVDYRVRRGLSDARPAAELQDGDLVLDGGCRSLFDSFCSVEMTVHVPPRINLHGGLEDGSLRGSGLVGTVDLGVADGWIDLDDLDADSVDMSVADGHAEISLIDAPASIRVRSADGTATVCLPADAPPYAVTVDQADGSVRVEVPDDPRSSRPMVLSTADGGITARFCTESPAD